MFEQLFPGLKNGLSGFANLFNGVQQPQPVMSGIPQPTLQVPSQNNKWLTLLQDLGNQQSRNSRSQDLYNVLPADQASSTINGQQAVELKRQELDRQEATQQAIRDIMADPQGGDEMERLRKIAAVTGDPSMVEKYLVNSGKGGTTPALIQIADQIMSTYPPEQRTPELYRQTIETAGKFYDKGIFNQGGGYGGYQPPPGGTPGIASPITPQMPPLPQGIQLPTDNVMPQAPNLQILDAPLLDGVERPATPMMPSQSPQSGFGVSDSYANAISSLEARKAAAKRQAEANVDLATKPDIARATELATNEGKSEAELKANMSKKARDARNVIGLADEADKILKYATSGKIDQAISASAKGIGVSTEATRADARLKVISAALTSNVPRFEGPQGVLDVELYRQAAGDVANSDLPWQDRKAALQTIRDLQSKYLPENQGSASGSSKGGKTGNPVIDKYLE